MNNPLGVSPSKGNQGTTRGKEKINGFAKQTRRREDKSKGSTEDCRKCCHFADDGECYGQTADRVDYLKPMHSNSDSYFCVFASL